MLDLYTRTSECDCIDCRRERYVSKHGDWHTRKIGTIPPRSKRLSKKQRARHHHQLTNWPLVEKVKAPSFGEIVAWNQDVPDTITVNNFPIPRTAQMASALQYYLEVFMCKMHPHREDAPPAWRGNTFLTERIQTFMADPMWFCANIALAEGLKERAIHDSFDKTDMVIKYQSKAFMDLRRRLMSDPYNDILLVTITVLITIDMLFRSWDSMITHTAGLEQILALRGGIESLNDNAYLKYKVVGFQNFWLLKQKVVRKKADITTTKASSYPAYPFSSQLCSTISRLPPDLANLACSGVLNINAIHRIADIASINTQLNLPNNPDRPHLLRRLKSLAYEVEELFTTPNMNQTDRLVIAALLDYCTNMDDDRSSHWLLGGMSRVNISPLFFKGLKWEKRFSKVMMWTGALLTACNEVNSMTWRLGLDALSLCAEHELLERGHLLGVCEGFVWCDALTVKLEEKFEFDEIVDGKSSTSPGSASVRTVVSAETGESTPGSIRSRK